MVSAAVVLATCMQNSIEADAGSTRKNDFASYEGEHGTLSMEVRGGRQARGRTDKWVLSSRVPTCSSWVYTPWDR
jgi:hypothetical protein